MIRTIKKHYKNILLILLILVLGIIIFNQFYNINNLNTGELIEELYSPNNKFVLKSYFINGGSLSANSVRVEVINNDTNESRNIYFNYPENKVNMKWIDDVNVDINGIELNINKETYDWRKKW